MPLVGLLLSVLLGLTSDLLGLLGLLLQHLSQLLDGLLEELLTLLLVLGGNLAQLLELLHDVSTVGDLLDVLLNVDPAAGELVALGLGLLRGVLDVLLQVAQVTRVDGGLGALEELGGVTLLQSIGVLLDELLDLGVLVEVGLGLLQTLLPGLVAELLDLLDLLLDELAGLGYAGGAEATGEDVLDLLPSLVNLLLGFGAVLVTELLQLIDVTAELLLDLRVVVDNVANGVTGEVGDLLSEVSQDIESLGGSLHAETGLGQVLELLVGIIDELVGLILVVLSNLLPILEGSIDVGSATRDPANVGVGVLLDVVHSLVGIGCLLLKLLCGGVILLLSL